MVARTKYKFYFVSPLFGFSAGIMLLQEFAEYILHRQLSTRCRVWCAIAITRRRAIRTDNTSSFPFHFSELTCLGYLRGSSYIHNGVIVCSMFCTDYHLEPNRPRHGQ